MCGGRGKDKRKGYTSVVSIFLAVLLRQHSGGINTTGVIVQIQTCHGSIINEPALSHTAAPVRGHFMITTSPTFSTFVLFSLNLYNTATFCIKRYSVVRCTLSSTLSRHSTDIYYWPFFLLFSTQHRSYINSINLLNFFSP